MTESTQKHLIRMQAENEALRAQVATLRQERVRLEEQLTRLANLYVASHRLHEAAGRRDLLDILQEIINNIIGSEQLGIFELDAKSSTLALVHSMGLEPASFQSIPLGTGVIGHTALTGQTFIAGEQALPPATGVEGGLTACIPLRFGSGTWGVIAIFGLLPHKPVLSPQDRELFELLERQAGLALAMTRFDPGT